MTSKQIKEQEAEEAQARQSAECAQDEPPFVSVFGSLGNPRFSGGRLSSFRLDLNAVKETNS